MALPAHDQGLEKGMARAALRTRRDAGHGGNEGGARAGRARPAGEGEPVVYPIQAPASDAPGSEGEAVGPHRVLHPAVPCREKHRALDQVVPCKENRDSGSEVTRTKSRVTEADLGSNGGAANALETNPAASEPGPTGGAGGLRRSGTALV